MDHNAPAIAVEWDPDESGLINCVRQRCGGTFIAKETGFLASGSAICPALQSYTRSHENRF